MSDSSKKVVQTISNIEKSKSYLFDTKIIVLQNGLTALLVSDPEAERSSAALGVNVGSYIDNPDENGLAHFCEHLLFMGTEKYPTENDYEEYLIKNSGDSNAYTGGDKTVYYFDVANDAFEGAIDRFAQFFICPTFNEGSVEREVNAVDSEFSKNKNNDTWRMYHFFKTQLAEGCCFNKFSTGSKETLNKPDIRDRLLKMYNKYYSSQIMYLVAYSKMPMDKLTKLVEDLFSLVPKKETFEMFKYDQVKPYNENTLKNFYKIVPVKDEDKIKFYWYLPFCENYHAKPLNLLSSLFGHEGPNTITSSLKRDSLITYLVTSRNEYAKTFSTFELEVTLTKKGLENYKEVILRILKYIKTIQSKQINERYFREEQNIAQLKFDFKDKQKPVKFTEDHVDYLMSYKPEDVFTGKTLYKEYNEEIIRKYLDLLNLDHLNIFFKSKSVEKECNLTEPIYGTKYTKEKITITNEEIDAYKCDHIFDYPPVNNFCPKNIDLYPLPENVSKNPEKILDDENCKVLFLQDSVFKLPRGKIKAQIRFVKNLCYNSDIKNEAISYLLKKIIKLEISEIIYMALEANAEFKIKIFKNKMEFSIEGFNDSLKNGLKEILTAIQNINITEEKHKEMLNLLIKVYINKKKNFFYDRSYKVNKDYTERLLTVPSTNPDDLIEFLSNEKITIDDIVSFQKRMFLETKSTWLIQGNFKKEQALEIVQMANDLFKLDTKKKITKPFVESRIVELDKNKNYIYRFKNPNKDEKDSSLFALYQCGQLFGEDKEYFNLIYSFLSEKFYDTLRTKETLGYIVYLTTKTINDIYHLVGVIQSNKGSPEFCSERVRAFFKEKEKAIKEITDEDFNSHVNSLLVKHTKKDRDLKEQFDRNWTEIIYERYNFNIKEESAEFLKKCTKEGFIQFFEKYFVKEVKKLDVEYVCEAHMEENEKKIKEECNDDDNIKKRIAFDKISEFHSCNRLYPSVFSYYRELNK